MSNDPICSSVDTSVWAWDLFSYSVWALLAPGWKVGYINSGHNPLSIFLHSRVQMRDLQSFEFYYTAAVRQMIQQRVIHQKELENLIHRLKGPPAETSFQQTIDMQLWHLKQQWRSESILSDIDGWSFSSGWRMTRKTNWELKPFPHIQPGHGEAQLHLSVYMKMLCSASVFISMTFFFQETPDQQMAWLLLTEFPQRPISSAMESITDSNLLPKIFFNALLQNPGPAVYCGLLYCDSYPILIKLSLWKSYPKSNFHFLINSDVPSPLWDIVKTLLAVSNKSALSYQQACWWYLGSQLLTIT